MSPALVYLSGPISGLTFGECTDWREYATRAFPPHIRGVSPLRAKRFLEGKEVIDKSYEDNVLATARGINTRDHYDVRRANVVLVNLLGCMKGDPNTRVSIGTVGELAWAWDRGIPIVAAVEKEGNIHDHPMLNQWLDYRMESLDQAIETVIAIISPHEQFMGNNLATLHLLKGENRLELKGVPEHVNAEQGFQHRSC